MNPINTEKNKRERSPSSERIIESNKKYKTETKEVKFPEELNEFFVKYSDNKEKTKEMLNEFQQIVDQKIGKYLEAGLQLEALELAQMAAEYVTFESSSLKNLKQEVERKINLQVDKRFGAHFHGFGGSLVKSGNIRVDKRDGDYWFQFKINYFAREELDQRLNLLKQLDTENVHIETQSITKQFGSTEPRVQSIMFRDKEKNLIAEIHIGNDKQNGAFYNNVEVRIPEHHEDAQMLKSLYTSLTFLGLGITVLPQTSDDDQRLKITKLFHLYAPKESANIRNSSKFHLLKPAAMQEECEKQNKSIQSIFKKYLVENEHLMGKVESYPERLHWAVLDLAEQMKEKGALKLITKVTGESNQVLDRAVDLLKTGFVSAEDRFRSGINFRGMSVSSDLANGSYHVFTRLVTKSLVEEMELQGVTFVFDLDVLNRGGYAYHEDAYGIKNPYKNNYEEYVERAPLVDFPQKLTNSDIFNEVMVPHHIPTRYISHVVGSLPYIKALKKQCEEAGLLQNDFIYNKHVDDFFIKNSQFQEKIANVI